MDNKIRSGTADDILNALVQKSYRTIDEHGIRVFVTGHSLRKVWTDKRLRDLFIGLEWADEAFLRSLRRQRLKILSTLVRIRWSNWESFKETIIDRLRITDEDLPVTDIRNLEHVMPIYLAADFQMNQYSFLPLTIKENDDQECPQGYQWPFAKESETLSYKGSCAIFKEVIAPRQFQNAKGEVNAEKKELVRKCCSLQDSYVNLREELATLARLRNSLSSNDRIMTNLGSVYYSNILNIFFPLADLDLDDYLYGRKQSDQIRTYPITPIALINEVAGLANALDYLHEGLHMADGDHFTLVHHDLKPANILVVRYPNTPVGRWKITDFGISRLKEVEEKADENPTCSYYHIPSVRSSLTVPRRPAGAFQAPEVESQGEKVVGPKSDIWGLGCILSLVFAYCLGGAETVKRFEKARLRRSTGQSPNISYMDGPDDYFYRNGGSELNEEAILWLRRLYDTNKQENNWAVECTSIICSILKIIPKERPTAKKVENELYERVVAKLTN